MTWILSSTLIVLYVVCLFTVCVLTFRKGHTALGIFGIIFPFLWLLGAIMPPKPGSAYDMEDRARLGVS
jgi:hypothetical protein